MIYGVHTDIEVCEFIDRYVSCSIPKKEEDDELYEIIDKIVDGSNDIAETLLFEPGTLSIFCGSRCLHEVNNIET